MYFSFLHCCDSVCTSRSVCLCFQWCEVRLVIKLDEQLYHTYFQHKGLRRTCPKTCSPVLAHWIETAMFKAVLSFGSMLGNSCALFILLGLQTPQEERDPCLQGQLYWANRTRRPALWVALTERLMSLSTSSVSWSKLKSTAMSSFCTQGTYSAHSWYLSKDTFLQICYSHIVCTGPCVCTRRRSWVFSSLYELLCFSRGRLIEPNSCMKTWTN